ncbi:MAG: metallophosphoesterase family protein [Thermodesulfobacteriota bacterium]
MRTIVHLSDLHFGREDPTLLDPLAAAVEEAQPHVVVVSGDLTQRARPAQFRRARCFLERLPLPQLVVPGNHDVPLYDVLGRLVRPLERFRRHVSDDLEPAWRDDEVVIVGVSTARARTLTRGRIGLAQIAAIRGWFEAAGPEAVRVLVTHHPLDLPAARSARHLAGRAELAVSELARSRVDLLLAGHLHTSHAGSTVERHRLAGRAAVFVQAATSCSTRLRGEANGFNVLRVAADDIAVEHHAFDSATSSFAVRARERFRRGVEGWERVAGAARG